MATKKKAAAKTVKKKKTARKKPVKVNTEGPAKVTDKVDEISVRMYCHGFGDCFLLTFISKGDPVYRMVIDCGMLTGNTDTLKQAIAHIKEECNGHLDLVVQTHEHKDHISGFNLKGKDKKLLWDEIEVDNAWLAWTENTDPGGDELAIELKKKFKKKKKALARALKMYNDRINDPAHKSLMASEFRGTDYHSAQQRYASALQQILNFFDIGPDVVEKSLKMSDDDLGLTMKDAMNYFVERNKTKGSPDIKFWNPGDFAGAETTGIKGINFYFLGPPKNYNLLKKMDDKEHVEMYLAELGLTDNFYMALTENGGTDGFALSPFQDKYCWSKDSITKEDLKDEDNVWNLYHQPKNNWRNIETDWLHNAGTLALHLDSYTNNTSLVIAMEFENSGKVLLFVADAQIGNWISWTEPESEDSELPKLKWQIGNNNKKITAYDLLERTVFYKVGHHASHNATAKKHGLELMNHKELAAMIPVDEEVAKKQGKKGWKMPAEELYHRLLERTKGRIIRADTGNLLKKDTSAIPEGAKPTRQQRQQFNSSVSESKTIITTDDGRRRPLFWEYRIKG